MGEKQRILLCVLWCHCRLNCLQRPTDCLSIFSSVETKYNRRLWRRITKLNFPMSLRCQNLWKYILYVHCSITTTRFDQIVLASENQLAGTHTEYSHLGATPQQACSGPDCTEAAVVGHQRGVVPVLRLDHPHLITWKTQTHKNSEFFTRLSRARVSLCQMVLVGETRSQVTFLQLSQSTAVCVWGIPSPTGVLLSSGVADHHPVCLDSEDGVLPSGHQQVGGEVVQPSSTSGNCEDTCCGVVPATEENGLSSWKQT